MIIIGEKINGSIPVVADAIARRDAKFIRDKWTKVNVEKMEKEENFLSDILYIPKKIDII